MPDIESHIAADLAPMIRPPDVRVEPPWPPPPFDTLSRRQLETARLLALGANNHEIAERMGVRVRSVDGYRTAVMTKLKIKNNVMLTRLALRMGLVTLEDSL